MIGLARGSVAKPPLPKGVTKRWQRYIATARDVDGKAVNLGIFLTAKEADDAIIRFIRDCRKVGGARVKKALSHLSLGSVGAWPGF